MVGRDFAAAILHAEAGVGIHEALKIRAVGGKQGLWWATCLPKHVDMWLASADVACLIADRAVCEGPGGLHRRPGG